MLRFTAKFYDEATGRLLEEVTVNGEPIHKNERIPNVANVALAIVTRVEPQRPARVGRGRSLMQKVWVRDWFEKN
jgi:hypothetical protein